MLILILFYPYNVLPSAVFANVQCTVWIYPRKGRF